jgi:hypothetical protein
MKNWQGDLHVGCAFIKTSDAAIWITARAASVAESATMASGTRLRPVKLRMRRSRSDSRPEHGVADLRQPWQAHRGAILEQAPGIEVVAEEANGEQMVQQVHSHMPDLTRLPNSYALSACTSRRYRPRRGILLCCTAHPGVVLNKIRSMCMTPEEQQS